MAAEQPGFIETIGAIFAKFWPGIAGALVSLRWQPEGATIFDRAFSAFGGVVLTMTLGPAAVEFAGVTSGSMVMGIAAVIGLFGMLVVGEITRAIKVMELGPIVRDAIRKFLRLTP